MPEPAPTAGAGLRETRSRRNLKSTREDLPLSNLYVTMLQRLGVETETFADNTGTISDV